MSSLSTNNRSAKIPPQNNSGSKGLALVATLNLSRNELWESQREELGAASARLNIHSDGVAFLDTFSAEGNL